MNEPFERLHYRVTRGAWPRAIEQLRTSVAEAARAAGGELHGIWRSRIGIPINEGVLVLRRPEGDPEARLLPGALEDAPDVSLVESSRMAAGGLPEPTSSPDRKGLYMHRWYEMLASDYEEFRAMSEESWPQLLPSFGSEVVGFWRDLDHPAPRTRVLTVTWYESLADWERSRGLATQEESKDLVRFLMRRQQLVESSVSTAMELVPLDAPARDGTPFS